MSHVPRILDRYKRLIQKGVKYLTKKHSTSGILENITETDCIFGGIIFGIDETEEATGVENENVREIELV